MNVVVRDNLFAELVAAACDDWPDDAWPGWVRYDPATQCKRASDSATPLPRSCGLLLAHLAALPVADWFPGLSQLLPDLALWGSGLHEMPPGPGLARHLDADTHRRLGLARALSAVLWVHDEWQETWGGELVLESGAAIWPAPGRLAVFDCRNEWHSVDPVTCPDGRTRRSLAMFWYAPEPGPGKRQRAAFAV